MNNLSFVPEPLEALSLVSNENQECIKRLSTHLRSLEMPDLSSFPRSKLAAVLVLLYEKGGQLRVLVTTRSKTLRTHAGQTALPGGKVDELDGNFFETALREAHEEVSLPLNCPDMHIIGLMEPLISLHRLLVTPVVAFLSCPSVLDELHAAEAEVAHIFSYPLEAILNPSLAAKTETLVTIGSEDWPYTEDYYSTSDSIVPMLSNTIYRMHRFRTAASPIKGLTADILIKVAEIAFAASTSYARFAEGQVRGLKATLKVLLSHEAVNPPIPIVSAP